MALNLNITALSNVTPCRLEVTYVSNQHYVMKAFHFEAYVLLSGLITSSVRR
jgi:hypothetical protein